ncbi:MAG: hypothetical protein ACKKMP_02265 [Candidatus Nealsonbacteria bacterium]
MSTWLNYILTYNFTLSKAVNFPQLYFIPEVLKLRNMNKLLKLSVLIIVLLLITGGVFYWKNQQEVAGLNKELPDRVRVVKTLLGDYVVVNKIDGYSFKIPEEWGGIKELYYTAERTEEGYTADSIEIEGKKGISRFIGIDRFKIKKADLDLERWAKDFFNTFDLIGDFSRDKVRKFEIVKTQENVHFGGEYVYFFKKGSGIYTITGASEEFIREIIDSGKW